MPGAPFSTGDRSLLDFFQVAIDKQGRANIALADNADSPGALITAYIRQTSGYSLTTGKRLKPQVVHAPQLSCPADGAFTDPSGDADEFVVSTPLPSAAALDIVRGYVTYEPARARIVVHTKVLDLKSAPAPGSTGEQVEFGFSYAGSSYFAVASRDVTQPEEYHIESPLRTSVGKALTGAFDAAKSEIRVNIPTSFFAQIKKGSALTEGLEAHRPQRHDAAQHRWARRAQRGLGRIPWLPLHPWRRLQDFKRE